MVTGNVDGEFQLRRDRGGSQLKQGQPFYGGTGNSDEVRQTRSEIFSPGRWFYANIVKFKVTYNYHFINNNGVRNRECYKVRHMIRGLYVVEQIRNILEIVHSGYSTGTMSISLVPRFSILLNGFESIIQW